LSEELFLSILFQTNQNAPVLIGIEAKTVGIAPIPIRTNPVPASAQAEKTVAFLRKMEIFSILTENRPIPNSPQVQSAATSTQPKAADGRRKLFIHRFHR